MRRYSRSLASHVEVPKTRILASPFLTVDFVDKEKEKKRKEKKRKEGADALCFLYRSRVQKVASPSIFQSHSRKTAEVPHFNKAFF